MIPGDSLQYENDLFDDDNDNDNDNDNEELLESDLAEAKPPLPVKTSKPANLPPAQQKHSHRRLRVRPMSISMMEKHPDVVSIMLTRNDGRQLAFVRK